MAPVRAAAGPPARWLIVASFWPPGEKGFLEEPVARSRGRALGSGGLGVTRVLAIGFTEGREALAGSRGEVDGTGFVVGGAAFEKGG